MGAELYQVKAREGVVLDTTRITALRRSVGDQRAREIVEEVVFHLADRLSLLREALDAGGGPEAEALAARLAALSEQLGLASFARVARDLGGCLAAENPVAVAAVGARLGRLADASLYSVIRYADQSAL
jgi:hypothetical protein